MIDYTIRAISDGEVLNSEEVHAPDHYASVPRMAFDSMLSAMRDVRRRTPEAGDISVQLIDDESGTVLYEETLTIPTD